MTGERIWRSAGTTSRRALDRAIRPRPSPRNRSWGGNDLFGRTDRGARHRPRLVWPDGSVRQRGLSGTGGSGRGAPRPPRKPWTAPHPPPPPAPPARAAPPPPPPPPLPPHPSPPPHTAP